ncbi:probable RNA-directed DNA polymerase from transposon X-element [Trichonephila clavipes]|nr:probable RNA-directed DNA polymerase from transposon X-element [Trichonephila clavipes]
MSWNADGLQNKMDELTTYIEDEVPDVVALQETFLRPSHDLNVANYSTHRCDRLTHRGGGTAILVKNSIPHHSIKINTSTVESTIIVIESQPNNITICSLYNPQDPQSATSPQISSRSLEIDPSASSWATSTRSIPLGVQPLTTTQQATLSFVLFKLMASSSQPQMGLQEFLPTAGPQPSTLESPVESTISQLKSTPNSLPGNPHISNSEELEESIVNFNTQIHNAVNQASKFKPILHSISNIPFETRLKIREKNCLRKLWQRTQYPPLKTEVNRLQRIIRTDLKNSKEHVWDSLQKDANINTDTLHKLVAGNNTHNNIIYPPILSSRGLVYGTMEKADCFVDNLEESFTENRIPYDDDHIDKVDRTIRRFLNNYSSSIPPLPSPQEICDIISKLNIHKAPGQDQIKNIALKSLPMNAITYLTKIFNKFLLLQYFPQIWKHCTISLLPKKNKDPKFPLNYRPISLISCVAKLFEKILLSRIQAFSDSNQIIPDFQHGFRKKTSTCHQLLRTTNLIIDGFNTHRTTGGIFLDVEKAFDRVLHNGLIFKLIQVNLPPYLIKIIYEYLSNRTFQVKINSIHSRIGSIQAGIPQGSILSPLLYSLYTYDFPTSPTVEVCLFADDAAILSQSRSPESVRKNLQTYLIKLKKWLTLWRISINTSKSQAIIFKKGNFKNKLNPLKLFRNPIPWCDEVQYLGVTLDKKLTYRNHILQTSKKFKLKLHTLHRLLSKKSKLNLDKKRLIYLQHLLPVILYACQIWGNTANYLLNKLQVLQNQALRTILNAPFYIPRIILHRELKITSIRSRIKILSLPFYNHLPSHHNDSIRMQTSFPVTGTHRPPYRATTLPRSFD